MNFETENTLAALPRNHIIAYRKTNQPLSVVSSSQMHAYRINRHAAL
jgi:hypothetical protein